MSSQTVIRSIGSGRSSKMILYCMSLTDIRRNLPTASTIVTSIEWMSFTTYIRERLLTETDNTRRRQRSAEEGWKLRRHHNQLRIELNSLLIINIPL